MIRVVNIFRLNYREQRQFKPYSADLNFYKYKGASWHTHNLTGAFLMNTLIF